eukprot:Pgem_evm1s7757
MVNLLNGMKPEEFLQNIFLIQTIELQSDLNYASDHEYYIPTAENTLCETIEIGNNDEIKI